MRLIEPFAYWPTQSSALEGFGGSEIGPDANYCFCTLYTEYQPGTVLLRVKMAGAVATRGEIELRVHAMRSDYELALVGGSRTPLNGLTGEDFEIPVRIHALPGIRYALYGRYCEPSDLKVRDLVIEAQELGEDEPANFVTADTARSLFGAGRTEGVSRLVKDGAPTLYHPVSQPCTHGQMAELGAGERWRDRFILNALNAYGVLQPGATGLLLGDDHSALIDDLARVGCSLLVSGEENAPGMHHGAGSVEWRRITVEELESLAGQFDFLVADGLVNQSASAAAAQDFINVALRRILRGGVAMFLFDYATDALDFDEAPFMPQRHDIERMAMRIIGYGSDVAQLSFPDGKGNNIAIGEVAPFGLIVRR